MAQILLRSFSLHTRPHFLIAKRISPLSLGRQYSSSRNEKNLARANTSNDNTVSTDVKLGEKIKQTAKTTSYLGIILLGASVTAVMFYAIFNELFSSSSPNAIYSDAFEKCKAVSLRS